MILKIALALLLISPTSAWCFGVGLGSGVVADGVCPSLTGSIATEDFSGSGLAGVIFAEDDANVTDPDDYNNTAVTAGCFSGQSFAVSGSDHWTRITSWSNAIQCQEVDFYLTSESLADSDVANIFAINNGDYSAIKMRLTQISGTLHIQGWFSGGKGDDIAISTGKAYRLGICHNSTANTGEWIVYDYTAGENIGSWSGDVNASLGVNTGAYIGPVNDSAAYNANFDNFEADSADWMQLIP